MQAPKIQNPNAPPPSFKLLGEIYDTKDTHRSNRRSFYACGDLLVIVPEYVSNARTDPKTGGPLVLFRQVEFPMDAAKWVVTCLQPFQQGGVLPGTITKYDIEIEGEELSLFRGPHIGGQEIPGWELMNLSRRYPGDNIDRFQSFAMSDAFLWEQGMFDLWKNIAERHKQGEF